MKQLVFILFAVLLATGTVSAKKKAIISSDSIVHNFGTIKEKDGKVNYTFVITNKGDLPLVVTRIVASCGCTTPEWTKEPIAPGKNGKIKVTYNPAGQQGPFSKTISVYSNGKEGSFIFTIKGSVVASSEEEEEKKLLYPQIAFKK